MGNCAWGVTIHAYREGGLFVHRTEDMLEVWERLDLLH